MRLSLLKLLPLVFLLGACVYRQSIPQGNFFKIEDVAKLEEGMTREQVQYVMGTPMIADPFHPDRWDYLFYVDVQDGEDYRRRVTVFFEGDSVTRIEKFGLDKEEQDVPTGDEGIVIEEQETTLPTDDPEIFTGEE
ncbi:MAG TPA: outer membrane protein assembly factor BamE [Gammaproteobacteria bacterium]